MKGCHCVFLCVPGRLRIVDGMEAEEGRDGQVVRQGRKLVQRCKHVRMGPAPRVWQVGEEKTDMRTVSKSGWAGHGGIGRLQEEGCYRKWQISESGVWGWWWQETVGGWTRKKRLIFNHEFSMIEDMAIGYFHRKGPGWRYRDMHLRLGRQHVWSGFQLSAGIPWK